MFHFAPTKAWGSAFLQSAERCGRQTVTCSVLVKLGANRGMCVLARVLVKASLCSLFSPQCGVRRLKVFAKACFCSHAAAA